MLISGIALGPSSAWSRRPHRQPRLYPAPPHRLLFAAVSIRRDRDPPQCRLPAGRTAAASAPGEPPSGSSCWPSGRTAPPGHQPRLHRHPRQRRRHRRQRRLHADLGAGPRSGRLEATDLHARSITSCRLRSMPNSSPTSARSANHPDPPADHPERRVDRRCLPDPRPGVLPVRRVVRVPPALEEEVVRRQARLDAETPDGRRGPVKTGTRPPRDYIRLTGRASAADRDRPRRSQPGRHLLSRPSISAPLRHPATRSRSRGHRPRRSSGSAALCPARPQRLVLGALGGPAHLAVRRPAEPDRDRRVVDRDRVDVRDGLVFFAAMLPNLLLSPIAGTFVDRWDHKEVMVVSDILRASIMLVIPMPRSPTSSSSTR